MASGIYIIHNKKTGYVYIGQAGDIPKRWKSHVQALNKKVHANRPLQTAWNEYGESAFKFKVLEYCAIDDLNSRETHYLTIHMARGICYNIKSGANSHKPRVRTQSDKKFSPSVRQIWVRSDPTFMQKLDAAVAYSGMAKADFIFMVLDSEMKKLEPLS